MNPDWLLKHFDQISEAPDAVPRLRRFILDLAVRGKLVPQDPEDESVSSLISRIQIERKRNGGKDQSFVVQPAIDKESDRFRIPQSWCWVRLGFLTNVVMGQSPPGETYNNRGDGVPLINGPVEFSAGPFGITVLNQYTTAPIRLCKKGDLLLCVRGSTTGRTNVAGFDACIGRGVAALQSLLDDQFVRLFIWSWREKIIEMGRGIAFPSISRAQIEDLPVPLPPLSEQHRIVSKVNELMVLCDDLEAVQTRREKRRDQLVTATLHTLENGRDGSPSRPLKQKEDFRKTDRSSFHDTARFFFKNLPRLTTRPEHIQQLRQAILNFAVRGKLVPQDQNDEPVSDLLRRISLERQSLTEQGFPKHRLSRLCPQDGSYSIPREWCWVSLARLITFGPQNGISPKPTNNERAPKSLTLTATTSGFLDAKHYKHVELNETDCESYWLSPGDVLFQRGNTREYVGIAAVFYGPERSFVFPDLMIRVRFSQSLDLRYIHMALISPPLRGYFSAVATGASSSMPKISQGCLSNAAIPIPPLPEQHQIVKKVDEVMTLCDQLETRLASTTSTRSQLVDSALH